MAPMTASDAPDVNKSFFTNLQVDPCTGCNYSGANGYLVLGPNNCSIYAGQTQWLTYPFVASHSGQVRRVTQALPKLDGIASARFP